MKKIIYFGLAPCLVLCSFVLLAQAQDTDTTAPAAIDNLAVSTTTASTITLTWTAPGDDNATGTAAIYDLRYATSTINGSSWGEATQASNEPTPQIAGSAESMTVSGLATSTTYYFAIKSKDEAGNESDLSNIANGTTLAPTPTPPPTPSADVTAQMNFTPQSLNLASQGNWVTAHLFLPAPYKAKDIDISSVKLNNTLSPDAKFKGLNLFGRGNQDKGASNSSNLVLKFSRSEFIALVGSATGTFNVTVTGNVGDKTFAAASTIKILSVTPEEDETLITSTSTPEVFVIKNGKKRHIPSPQAFNRHGYKWQNIKVLLEDQLESYPDDELIKADNSPAVYIIVAGMKRHIPSPAVFIAYGFDWNNISVVSSDELADYPDVILIRAAEDAKVYLLAGGKKHWIPSLAVFNKHGYKWPSVIIVNATEKDAIPEGENVE